jgi:membrane peptidoglycan carboxypeptidase
MYPALGSITGYTQPTYGQAGLEATLDPYLRGLDGNPARSIWWDHLVYGQPPPGLDVRLSIDLNLQKDADSLLGKHVGAVIMLDASSGEILAMASHPTFDPNLLEQEAPKLLADPQSPLLDRAAQSAYPPGKALQPFLHLTGLTAQSQPDRLDKLYSDLGFYSAPDMRLPVAAASKPGEPLKVSPMQMALAAGALSNAGIRTAPRLAVSVNTPLQGWVILPTAAEPQKVLDPTRAEQEVMSLTVPNQLFWQWTTAAVDGKKTLTWSIGGTLPDWQGSPLAVVVLLEDEDPAWAAYMGLNLLSNATQNR